MINRLIIDICLFFSSLTSHDLIKLRYIVNVLINVDKLYEHNNQA